MPVTLTPDDRIILTDLAEHASDPLWCVRYAFPWESEELDSRGPRTWQREVLQYIGQHLSNPATRFTPCQIGISSGHDVGKSSLISMIVWWALSTSVDCRVNISANTEAQLK